MHEPYQHLLTSNHDIQHHDAHVLNFNRHVQRCINFNLRGLQHSQWVNVQDQNHWKRFIIVSGAVSNQLSEVQSGPAPSMKARWQIVLLHLKAKFTPTRYIEAPTFTIYIDEGGTSDLDNNHEPSHDTIYGWMLIDEHTGAHTDAIRFSSDYNRSHLNIFLDLAEYHGIKTLCGTLNTYLVLARGRPS